MMNREASRMADDLKPLCGQVRALAGHGEYAACERLLCEAMARYPHAPEPHNLMGVLLEEQGNHLLAMKHFRAAWALDPAYRPARNNLDRYASFSPRGVIAFDEDDCGDDPSEEIQIVYDERGIGRVVRGT